MSKKILAVDTDEGLLEVFEIVFREQGYEINTQTSVNDIVKVVSEYQPDLILIDIANVSIIDGKEAITLLIGNSQTKHIPIINVSAHYFGEEISRGIGADGFIPKPFDLDQLLKILKENLK